MSSPRILVVLRSFYASFFSLFHLNRLAGLARRVVTISLVLVLIGNHALAVPQGMLALTRDLTYSAWFWWQAGGWAARYAKFAPQSQNSPKGWDGKGAPAQAMPEPEPQETQAERDARVVRIEVVPKQLALEAGERANFSVIGYDRNQEPVGTLPFNWSGEDEATGEKIDAQQKAGFAGSKVGTYKIRVEAAGHSAESRVTVRPNLRMSGEKPIRTYTVSSRDLPQQTRSTSSLPVTRGSIAKKAKNGLGELVARNSPLGTKVMPPILLPGEDPYGWTAENYQTADDPNTQRGNPIGQAPDGGAGSANFQIDVPLLSLKGRGLDLNLGLHYNSRLWHKAGSQVTFDIDRERVPGWVMGGSRIVAVGKQSGYMIVEADGTRRPFTCTINVYQTYQRGDCKTTDGSLIDYYVLAFLPTRATQPGAPTDARAFLPNGTAIQYGNVNAAGANAAYATSYFERNGNFLRLNHRQLDAGSDVIPRLDSIVDTLGRVIQFYYDSNDLPVAITAPGLNGTRRTIVRINYVSKNLGNLGANYGYSGLTPMVRNASIPAIKAIYYPANNTGYWFGDADSYSAYGMISKVIMQRDMGFSSANPLPSNPTQVADPGTITQGVMTRQMVYDYPMNASSLTAEPAYQNMTETWAAMNVSPAVTHFSMQPNATPRRSEITRPDGVRSVMLSRNTPNQYDDGRLYQTETYSPQDVLLGRTYIEWELGDFNSARQSRVEITDERNQKIGKEFSYGPRFNQLTELREYDFDYVYGMNVLLRKTRYEYVTDTIYSDYGAPGYNWKHILNLVTVKEVFAGDSGARLSRTEMSYDDFKGTTALKDTPGFGDINSPEFDQFHNPRLHPSEYAALKYDYRGNVTTIKRYADAVTLDNSTAVVETRHYDITGNLVEIDSTCCEKAVINYTLNTKYSWPESTVRGSASDAAQQNSASMTYDFNTGLIKTATDANGRISQNTYDSNSLRLLYEYAPTGAYNYYIYDDPGLSVLKFAYEADQSGSSFASRVDQYLNGRGQVHGEIAYGKDYVLDLVDTEHDQLGRVSRQSRPYRYEVETPQWTTMIYDSLDRVTQMTAPDGSITRRFYNESNSPSAAASSTGSTMRMKDAWGRERWSRFDALNRLVEVVEPDPAGNGTVASNGLSTRYSYDYLDNLTSVQQGSQTRSFKYDGLSRLTHQKLAEQEATLSDSGSYVGSGTWSSVFNYDTRSNLIQSMDARGVKTYFIYNNDPLSRLRAVQYDKTGAPDALEANIPDAPNVTYDYLTVGDKTRVQNVNVDFGMGNQTFSYDTEGRLSRVSQTFTGRESYPLLTDYVYDSLDRQTDLTYPKPWGTTGTRQVANQTYDLASRLNSLSFGDTTLASGFIHNSRDQVTTLNVGSQTVEDYGYDAKTDLLTSQQVTRGTDLLLNLRYNYTQNNDPDNEGAKTGQLVSLTDLKNQVRNRAYNYDQLERLKQVKGGSSFTAPTWTQSYSYDRYGNRSGVTKTGSASNIPLDGLTSLTFNASNNRITSAGFEYDPAGNQTRAVVGANGLQQQYRYDAAGRLAQVLDGSGNVLATYSYGDGNERLKSVEGSVTTYYGWGDGQVLTEYDASGTDALQFRTNYIYMSGRLLATTDAGGMRFHHADRLGTRLVTDADNGEVVTEQLTLPFGTMQPNGGTLGGDNSWQHATKNNPSKRRFTSYERSLVTGIDYAVNRHYSSPQGRFMQVDPSEMDSVELANPQSLNLYAYVENDPVNQIDPGGLDGLDYSFSYLPYPIPSSGGGGQNGFSIGGFGFSFRFGGNYGYPAFALFRGGAMGGGASSSGSFQSTTVQFRSGEDGWLDQFGKYINTLMTALGLGNPGDEDPDAETVVNNRLPSGRTVRDVVRNDIIPAQKETVEILQTYNEMIDPTGGILAAATGRAAGIRNNQDVATAALGSLVGSLGRYSKPLLGHIFRDAVGHVNPSTLGARAGYMKLFEAVATKPTNYRSNFPLPAAAAKAGVEAYTQVFRNGKQVWVYTRNGKIIDAGVNLPGAHR